MKKDPVKGIVKRLIRSPADIFYYSGAANDDGCLAIGKDCWASPKDLKGYWQSPFDLEVLILAGSSVLSIEFLNGKARGPGVEWTKLLKSKGGPLTAILGYGGEAPADKPVGNEIAYQMGEKIVAGLNDDQWVKVWLKINGDHSGRQTWNAVGMDEKGYWWIEKRSQSDRARKDWLRYYEIKGPTRIP
jgi:hypothetical protein